MAHSTAVEDTAYCEAVLADLRMLGTIGKNDNVYTGQGDIQLAPANPLNGLLRRYLGEGRLTNVEHIKEKVDAGFDILRTCVRVEEQARALRVPPTREEFDGILRNRQRLARFKKAMRDSVGGIETLARSTYGADTRTKVLLDIQAQNITLTLERVQATEDRLPPASVDIGAGADREGEPAS